MWREFIFKCAVAVRTFPQVVTVDPDFTVAIDALEFDEDLFSFCACGNRKRLAIPAKATRQCAAARAGRSVFTETAFDTPVVRQIQLTPLRLAQRSVLSVGNIAEVKAPVLIERDSLPGPRIRETDGGDEDEETKSGNDVQSSHRFKF